MEAPTHGSAPPAPAGRITALILCALTGLWASPVVGHSFYDPWCCNERDCNAYPKAEVQPVEGGWMVKPTPEADPIFFKTDAYRVSADGFTHLCIYQGQARCIYLAPRS